MGGLCRLGEAPDGRPLALRRAVTELEDVVKEPAAAAVVSHVRVAARLGIDAMRQSQESAARGTGR